MALVCLPPSSAGAARSSKGATLVVKGKRAVPLSSSVPVVAFVGRARAQGCKRATLTAALGKSRLLRTRVGSGWRSLRAPLTGKPGRHTVRLRARGCAVEVGGLGLVGKSPFSGAPPKPKRRPAAPVSVAAAPKRQVMLGAAFDWRPNFWADFDYQNALIRSYDALTPENSMKWEFLQPQRDQFDFFAADGLVNFAERHGKSIHGHTLIWHEQLPGWMRAERWGHDELAGVLKNYIANVVGRWRGRIPEWDVVNEVLDEDGTFRESLFYEALGADFIELAFRYAHEADPSAKLFINDYDIELAGPKGDAMVALVADLKRKGVPIHGVGIQMHWDEETPPDPDAVAASLRRFTDLGVEVQVTEMDVAIQPGYTAHPEHIANQQAQYAAVAGACNALPACSRFTVWGVSDRYTWRGAETAPLLLDVNFAEKPVYGAVRSAFAPRG